MKGMKKITIGMIITLLVIIGIIGSDFYLLWLPLAHTPEYPAKVAALFMAITAVVTLFLALATFNATEQSNLREQQHRKDEIEKEKRDGEERVLNEILEWARRVLQCWIESGVTPSATDLQRLTQEQANRAIDTINKFNRVIWLYRLEALESESENTKAIALIFKISELDKAIDEVDKKLLAHIEVMTREVGEGEVQTEEYRNTAEELKESAKTLSKLVGNIRAKLINKIA